MNCSPAFSFLIWAPAFSFLIWPTYWQTDCIYIWWHASFFKISDKTLRNSEMVMAIFVPILHFAVANLSCNTLSSLFYFWYKPGLVNVFIFTLSQHGKYTCTHEQSSSKSGSTHTSDFLRSPGHHMNLGVKTLQHLCPGIALLKISI